MYITISRKVGFFINTEVNMEGGIYIYQGHTYIPASYNSYKGAYTHACYNG
jgi:hypothetical protein